MNNRKSSTRRIPVQEVLVGVIVPLLTIAFLPRLFLISTEPESAFDYSAVAPAVALYTVKCVLLGTLIAGPLVLAIGRPTSRLSTVVSLASGIVIVSLGTLIHVLGRTQESLSTAFMVAGLILGANVAGLVLHLALRSRIIVSSRERSETPTIDTEQSSFARQSV
ncbi:hypothetical protein M2390_000080 [Mycetocola sp. BIGb0189]|uniref:hypothetical protein n=1 Tax=Mycetocola sp. BIGb0189 TaxID=2940604 RepID=UPI0021671206|nr:hypothetical protein [Mycetocola sp. BIGb0189]MCS4274922.1 hypothetical protein [Mycetocola sp. BIGb0189]